LNKQFYILSTGRCGTTFLSKLIGANKPAFTDVHQLPDSKWLNVQANLALSNKSVRERFTSSLSRKYNHELPPSSADPLRSVAYFFYLKKLLDDRPELINDAVIIHLLRDPRDFVSSFINWKNRRLSGRIAHHLTPFWMPEPKLKERLSMSKFEHFCWIWNKKNHLFEQGFSHLPNYHLFKIEDLKPDSDKLYELLSLITNKGKIKTELNETNRNKSIKKEFPSWENWDSKQAKKLDTICTGMMQKFGYGQEKKWTDLL